MSTPPANKTSSDNVDTDDAEVTPGKGGRIAVIVAIAVLVIAVVALLILYLSANSSATKTSNALVTAEDNLATIQTDLATVKANLVGTQSLLTSTRATLTSTQESLTSAQKALAIETMSVPLCGTYVTTMDATEWPQSGFVASIVVSRVAGSSNLQMTPCTNGRSIPSASLTWITGSERTWTVWLGATVNTVIIDSSAATLTIGETLASSTVLHKVPEYYSSLAHIQGVYRSAASTQLGQLSVSFDWLNSTITVVQYMGPGLPTQNHGIQVDGGQVIVNALPWTFGADAEGSFTIPYTSDWNAITSGTLKLNPVEFSIIQTQTTPPETAPSPTTYRLALDVGF